MKTAFLKNNLVRAVVALVLGILLLVWPGFVAGSIVKIIGIAAIVAGVVSISLFFKDKAVSSLVTGIIEALVGLLLLFNSGTILKYLFVILGLVLIAFAIGEIVRLLKEKSSWKLYILPAVVAVLGIVVFFQPEGSVKFTVILFGIALIVYAVSEFVTSITKK